MDNQIKWILILYIVIPLLLAFYYMEFLLLYIALLMIYEIHFYLTDTK